MEQVWVKYSKKTSRSPVENNHYVYLEKETIEDEDEMNALCLEWAESIPGGERYGFQYDWEIVDSPPVDWLDRAQERAERDIISATERSKTLLKEILRVTDGKGIAK